MAKKRATPAKRTEATKPARAMTDTLYVITLLMPDGTRLYAQFHREPGDTIAVPTWEGARMEVNAWGEIAPFFGQIRLQRTDERDEFGFVVYR